MRNLDYSRLYVCSAYWRCISTDFSDFGSTIKTCALHGMVFVHVSDPRQNRSAVEVMAVRRLQKEVQDLTAGPVIGAQAAPVSDTDLFHWHGSVVGPEGSPYEGGNFSIAFQFPEDYPFKPPTATFLTKIFHPNVGDDGVLSLDILEGSWSPGLRVIEILLAIVALLMDPSGDSPGGNPEMCTKAKE